MANIVLNGTISGKLTQPVAWDEQGVDSQVVGHCYLVGKQWNGKERTEVEILVWLTKYTFKRAESQAGFTCCIAFGRWGIVGSNADIPGDGIIAVLADRIESV